ncbi:MAG: peptidylprolyl isomerase [Alysiella sp.]|uniref:peptidylprolyl isomerase n=1 Tax=Alysiella sp. TaxID=1872483 RepID=UPI0026DAA4B5|nr:peptidylprolyl isomerase [Alysiella sp.]MDO4433599.1 peptidylprolyl isomerase [Alysiella sp.]
MKLSAKLTAVLLSTLAYSAQADTRVLMETNMGNIELLLNEHQAPQTVANFVQYARQGFYNGTIFHRVIDGFMIQGGGFTADMVQKTTSKPIKNEADNGLKNTIGTIAMARTADPHSATAQFFINVADNPNLDFTARTQENYGYTVFGRVSKGMDVVNRIAKVRTINGFTHQNVPMKTIEIKSVKVMK